MAQYIIDNWFIILPVIIILSFLLWFLIKKGYLQGIDLFGVKLDFKNPENKVLQAVQKANHSDETLKDYKIKFTKTALSNISSLNITEDTVIQLVEREFTHHVNYFYWDLQDYPLPVQLNYIVVLDKIEDTITFRAIKRADVDEIQLASINNLLADYRRLNRYEYRNKKNYILRSETAEKIVAAHWEIIKRLIKHYEIFKDDNNGTLVFIKTVFDLTMMHGQQANDDELRNLLKESPQLIRGFTYNIFAATSSLNEISRVNADEKNRLISQESADQDIVVALENSLQHIHKMITSLFE